MTDERQADYWYDTVVREHEKRLMSFVRCFKYRYRLNLQDIEDISQSVRLRACECRQSYDKNKGLFAPWFMGVARKVIWEELCRLAAYRKIHAPLNEEQYSAVCDHYLQMVHPGPTGMDDAMAVLKDCLETLSTRDKEIIVSRFQFDEKSPEIGKVLDMKAGAVRTRLRRALVQLKECILSKLRQEPSYA